MPRNHCAACLGIGVRLTPDSLCALPRILQLEENEQKALYSIYKQLRKEFKNPDTINRMIQSLFFEDDYDQYRRQLIQHFWQYAELRFHPINQYFDRSEKSESRPPVFLEK